MKSLLIIFKGIPLKQIKINFLEGESPTSLKELFLSQIVKKIKKQKIECHFITNFYIVISNILYLTKRGFSTMNNQRFGAYLPPGACQWKYGI